MIIETNGLESEILKEIDRKQKIIDAAVLRYMDPYIPYRSGTLAKSALLNTVIGSGKIVQATPYARYMYYGEIYGPNIPLKVGGEIVGFYSPAGMSKTPTGRMMEYDKTKHPLAGRLWFERMKKDHLNDIKKEAGIK